MATIIMIDAHGKRVEVEVSDDVAIYWKENKRYVKRLQNIDERDFQLMYFEPPAWENLYELSTRLSAEEQWLETEEALDASAAAAVQRRQTRHHRMLHQLKDACTEKQWRRFVLHKVYGYPVRKIAAAEGCSQVAVWHSIDIVGGKLKKLLNSVTE